MPRPAAPLVVTRTADVVRVAWDNRTAAGRLPLLALIAGVFALLCTLLVTLAADTPRWYYTAPLVAFVGLVATACGYTVLSRRWEESIELTPAGVAYLRSGFLAPGPRRYPLAAIAEVNCGRFPPDGDDREAIRTLNLVHAGAWLYNNRTIVGYWLRPADQRRVFEALRAFAADAGLAVRFVLHDEDEPTPVGIPPNAG